MITVGSLFSGIGGLDLAFQWAGASIVYQVEIDEYCRRVLARHWPGVARHEDVRNAGKHNLPAVDVICGGVPCQPASTAGKYRRGESDERWIWPDAIRIVDETRPRAFLWENVPGLRTLADGRAFAGVVGAFAEIGYCVEWHHLAAAHIGASHRRERIWIMGYAVSIGHRTTNNQLSSADQDGYGQKPQRIGGLVSDETIADCFVGNAVDQHRSEGSQPQPRMGRTVNGFPTRLDVALIGQPQHDWEAPRMAPKGPEWANRIKALGNAVVPQQAYPFARALVQFLEVKQ